MRIGSAPKRLISPCDRLIDLTVTHIDRDASRVLPRGELSAQLGGHVLLQEFGF